MSRKLKEPEPRTTTVSVPTAESPQYRLLIGELAGGRRLLSDDLDFLESVALMVARRIDAARVTHERCLRDLHEQEIRKLATEAELRALRAQINPHFLFNALTTIGYLIQTAPDRALDTLMRLTQLLRGVLRRSEGEFATLGEEIELIESYLDIESSRFEDRLRVMIDVPSSLRQIRVPALLIQPLVENAIKHGVSPCRAGGEVVILARLERADANQTFAPTSTECALQIWVRDTGVGASEQELAHERARGIGLQNVEQRIKRHYGDAATFDIRSASGVGTTVELGLPVNLAPEKLVYAAAGGAAAVAVETAGRMLG
jgi:LytS/YehU family sensor histidine kinase